MTFGCWVRAPSGAPGEQPCNPPIDSKYEATLKLYIIVRSNLPPGAQAAQACHALLAFVKAHPIVSDYWHHKSNNLVVLQVPDESCLLHLAGRAQDEGIEHSVFREPDFDNTVTAVALEPAGRRLVSNLALALRRAA